MVHTSQEEGVMIRVQSVGRRSLTGPFMPIRGRLLRPKPIEEATASVKTTATLDETPRGRTGGACQEPISYLTNQ